jgi:hypothetical protein
VRSAESRQKGNAASREWKRSIVAELAAIKLSRGCADCGYRVHAVALDFDHRPGETKLCGVSRAAKDGRREDAIAEAAKCDVVCANCHRIRSWCRGDFGARKLA